MVKIQIYKNSRYCHYELFISKRMFFLNKVELFFDVAHF